ncbi:hypothetical protein AYO40_00535 [Planctomycetaceae bacterium SCGC AG-212-D15]|nr:hypothetical protein AYO40_00535 [Planctomycetaceae bacterium SCGC AG-212-D15]
MNSNPLNPSAGILRSIRNRRHKALREEAFQQLLSSWEPIVVAMARRYAPQASERPDFEQAGRMAILRAAEKFRAGVRNRFEHYARRAVRHALLDEARAARRRQVMTCVKVLLPEKFDNEDGLSLLVRRELQTAVRQACRRLDQRLRTIVERVYGHQNSQADVARALEISPARITQILKRFRSRGLADFERLMD